MLIYGQQVGEQDCDFNVSNETKNVLVGFFGFFRHDIHERFVQFLEELEIKEIADQSKFDSSLFSLNGEYGLQTYDCCDRRTFDVTILLPKVFDSEKSALNWFNEKLRNSRYMLESELSDIGVVDGDKILECLKERKAYKEKVKFIKEKIEMAKEQAKQNLLEEYSGDEDYKYLIDHYF